MAEVTFVVPNRSWEERFLEDHAGEQRNQVFILGEDAAFAIQRSAWDFIVLEDPGIQFVPGPAT